MNIRTDTHRVILLQCHADACEQGRKPCPCPHACEQAGNDETYTESRYADLIAWLTIACTVVALGAVIVWKVMP